MKKNFLLLGLWISVVLQVNAQCPQASFTSTSPACQNTPVDFTNTSGNTGGGWTYFWDFDYPNGGGSNPSTSTSQNPTNIDYSPGGNGVYTVAFTITNTSSGCSSTILMDVYIRKARADFSASTSVACEGNTVSFINQGVLGSSPTATVTHTWNFGTGATPSASNAVNPPPVTYSTPGIKTITHSVVVQYPLCGSTKSDQVSQTIVINPKPTVTFSSTAPVCEGSNVDFTYTGTTSSIDQFNWDFGANATPTMSSAKNPVSIMYGTSGTKSVSLTVTNQDGCFNTGIQNITINAKPVATFTSTAASAPQCTGLGVNFTNTGTTGATYAWSFDTGSTPNTSTTENPSNTIYSTAGIKIVKLIVNNGTCADSVSNTITIHQTPSVSFTTTAPQCAESGVNLSNTGATGFNWSYSWGLGQDATPATSNSENPVGVTYSTGGSKVVTLTIADQFCTNTATQNITINTKPVAAFTSTAPECTGLGVNFTNTGTTGATYAWSFDTGSTPNTSTTENPSNTIYSTAGIKTVKLIVNNGTCSDSVSNTFTIHQTPSVSFTTTAPQCAESGVNLSNTGATGFNWSYSWGLGQDAIPATSNSENPVGVTYSTGGSKVVTLTIADQFCTSTDTATININALPIANAGVDTTICPNTTVQIGDVSNTNYTYNWFPSNTLVISNSAISNPIATPVASITNYVVTVIETATNCVSIDTATVTMISPIVADAGVDVEICRYDSVQLGAGSLENQHYVWSPVNGLTGSIMSNPMVSPDSSTTYTVTVSNEYNCPTASDQVTVTVHQLPLIYAGVDDTITVGSSTQLIVTGGLQYDWNPIYGLDNSGIYNPIANPDTTTIYTVQGIDVYGCINYDTVTVNVLIPATWIPNAFTPDDIYNNILYVRGQGVNNFQFRVFDRDGAIVFYSQSMDKGWNGSQQLTHEKLPQGAYVYDIQGVSTDGEAIHESGIVNLIR